jgi:hypothetical protein
MPPLLRGHAYRAGTGIVDECPVEPLCHFPSMINHWCATVRVCEYEKRLHLTQQANTLFNILSGQQHCVKLQNGCMCNSTSARLCRVAGPLGRTLVAAARSPSGGEGGLVLLSHEVRKAVGAPPFRTIYPYIHHETVIAAPLLL